MDLQIPKATAYDVRRLPAERKRSAVLSMFDGLRPGQTFTVVLDFDPETLKRQFEAFFPDDYVWTCLEAGPPDWLVEIGRPESAR
ncbi:DUF2249 domain-containing protein [Mesorhizobium sp. RIZ17]|uniref:DUF2249 domain-containing protein n=1 Tax=Mesorhizobium sp. RIZ17 TaxID=3132743 RepID=UPI003DA88599